VLGRTGLSVSVLGFGTAPLGDLYAQLDDGTAITAVERAFELGINLLDTSPLYGRGLSEHRCGTAIRRVPRQDIVVCTKVGRWMDPFHGPGNGSGFVGGQPHRAVARIDALAVRKLLVGLRPMVQDIDDDNWLLGPTLAPLLAAMARNGLVFDALVLPRHLPRLLRMIGSHPDLKFVLDHCGKPLLATGEIAIWQRDIALLAEHPNIVCKLSGLVTEAAPDWQIADLRKAVDHVRACFGPQRMLWGSDWPVVNLAGGYAKWFAAAETLLADLSPDEKADIFGGNAARIYLSSRGLTC